MTMPQPDTTLRAADGTEAVVRVGDVVPMTDGGTRQVACIFGSLDTECLLLTTTHLVEPEQVWFFLTGEPNIDGVPAIDIAALAARQSAAPPAGAEGALAERLEALLRSVATQFRLYERNHAVKRTLDGDEKAAVNKRYADHVESEGATILRALRSDAGRAVALEEAARVVDETAAKARALLERAKARYAKRHLLLAAGYQGDPDAECIDLEARVTTAEDAARDIRSLQPAGLCVLTPEQVAKIRVAWACITAGLQQHQMTDADISRMRAALAPLGGE